ncbi:dTDP-4-amino-4,6-dideoxyglucose formyltransferase [Vibrio chagasii]|uniref:dTDP-4-amino-4,6-dideoxyglucose formyltransferase n=1 Tax=Vibrio chagasii TaxID=170679 RepID=UPI003378147C|nr:putative enzyme [Vibrio chagasii]
MKVLVISDNTIIFEKVRQIFLKNNLEDVTFDFGCSPESERVFSSWQDVSVIDVKAQAKTIVDNYQLVISCHCKKIFPPELVNHVRCINIHPGLNPYNRGWYPQVFAINNKLPHGVTIHEMDEEIDHGDIIAQKNLTIYPYETSLDVYNRVLEAEVSLFEDNFKSIIRNTYEPVKMSSSGNYNGISDFKELCQLDLTQKGTLEEHIDLLRSMTHGEHKNAYFNYKGKKVFVGVSLVIEE